jgi:predicted PurR-regulated permease PerM
VAATDDRFAARVFNLAVLALLGYALLRIFRPFLGPILWAFLLAFLLFPLNQRLRARVKGRRWLAALLLTLAVTLVIVIPVVVGAVAFARQAVELGQGVSRWASEHRIGGVEDILKLPLIGSTITWLEKDAALDAAQVQAWLVEAAQAAVQFLLVHSRDFLLGALGLFGDLTLTLFVLFFFFRDGDDTARRIRGLIPLNPRRKAQLDRRLQDVTRAVVFGTVVTALVQGLLLGIGFWITGLPSPVVFGVVGTISSFVPLVGTTLVWLPAAIYLFAKGVLWKAIFMAAWGALVVGSADNFLRPFLVSGKAEIGTLTVFFGVLGGLATFGMIGLFLGPVILALALALIEFAEEGRAEGSTA